MAEYRAFIIDHDDHVMGCKDLICFSDADASACARQLADDHAVEIWSGERFVSRLPPRETSAVQIAG